MIYLPVAVLAATFMSRVVEMRMCGKCITAKKVHSQKKLNQLIKKYYEWCSTESKKQQWFWKLRYLYLQHHGVAIPTYRLVVVGDSGVGKSPLITQLIQNQFQIDWEPTLGDMYQKQFNIDGETYCLEIMDTAGVWELRANTDYYIRQGQGFMIVYSVIRRTSFDSVLEWYHQILAEKDLDKVPLVLVGTHCDLNDKREISTCEGQQLAKHLGCAFFETSAKTRVNVQEVFFELVRETSLYYKIPTEKQKKRRSKTRKIKGLKSVFLWTGNLLCWHK